MKYPLTTTFTAYTLSVDECDENQNVGAGGHNLKEYQERGIQVCASRDLPLHTVIYIEGVGRCEVLDRTSKKYAGRIDILFKDKKSAINFGIKKLNYLIK